jgi:hypothetical protein
MQVRHGKCSADVLKHNTVPAATHVVPHMPPYKTQGEQQLRSQVATHSVMHEAYVSRQREGNIT